MASENCKYFDTQIDVLTQQIQGIRTQKLQENCGATSVTSEGSGSKFTDYSYDEMKTQIISMLPLSKTNDPALVIGLVKQMIEKMRNDLKENSNKSQNFYNIITELLQKILPLDNNTNGNNLNVLTNSTNYQIEANKSIVANLLAFSLFPLQRDITIKINGTMQSPTSYKYIIGKGFLYSILP